MQTNNSIVSAADSIYSPSAKQSKSYLRDPYPIQLNQIRIFTKQSKLEYDMSKSNLNFAQMKDLYQRDGVDLERILKSHQRQLESLSKLTSILPESQIVKLDINDTNYHNQIRDAGLVVAFGGDNHFQRVSHLVEGNTPILGINSDPKSSFGALLNYTAESFISALDNIRGANYSFEPWSRISVEINGKVVGMATCDVFLGESRRQMMSHYRLNLADNEVEHKSSGLIVSTGAGSGGWFNSAIRPFFPDGLRFPKTGRLLRFVSSEISATGSMKMPYGEITDDQLLLVESLNDDHGILSLDSLDTFEFQRGAVAKLILHPDPLWVLVPKKEELYYN